MATSETTNRPSIVAVYPDHGSTGPAVLEAADDALYQAKAAGRDMYRVARPRGAAPPGARDGGTVTNTPGDGTTRRRA